MLALDFGLEYYRTEPASSHLRGTGSDQHSKGPRYPLVTFDMFVADLWSHFPENLTKGLGELRVVVLLKGTYLFCHRCGPCLQRDYGRHQGIGSSDHDVERLHLAQCLRRRESNNVHNT